MGNKVRRLGIKSGLTKKVANIFVAIGDTHANECSIGGYFYEPKVSMNLLRGKK